MSDAAHGKIDSKRLILRVFWRAVCTYYLAEASEFDWGVTLGTPHGKARDKRLKTMGLDLFQNGPFLRFLSIGSDLAQMGSTWAIALLRFEIKDAL